MVFRRRLLARGVERLGLSLFSVEQESRALVRFGTGLRQGTFLDMDQAAQGPIATDRTVHATFAVEEDPRNRILGLSIGMALQEVRHALDVPAGGTYEAPVVAVLAEPLLSFGQELRPGHFRRGD